MAGQLAVNEETGEAWVLQGQGDQRQWVPVQAAVNDETGQWYYREGGGAWQEVGATPQAQPAAPAEPTEPVVQQTLQAPVEQQAPVVTAQPVQPAQPIAPTAPQSSEEMVRRALETMPQMGVPPRGVSEAVTGLAATAGAEAASGLAGIGAGINQAVANVVGLGDETPPMEAAAEAQAGVREALTPEMGAEGQQLVGQAVEAIPDPVKAAAAYADSWWDDVSDETAERFGPAMGAIAQTLPTAVLTLAGGGAGGATVRGATRPRIPKLSAAQRRMLKEAAPSADHLSAAAGVVYNQIDDMGVILNEAAAERFLRLIERRAKSVNVDMPGKSGGTITPNAARVVEKAREVVRPGEVLALEDLTRILGTAKQAVGGKDSGQVKALMEAMHSYLRGLKPQHVAAADGDVTRLHGLLKHADDLFGRAKRSETIQKAIENADIAASGLENGLRNAFRSIVNNRTQQRFFTREEIAYMKRVAGGTVPANITKALGRLGLSEGGATNMLLGSLGIAGGAYAAGPAGAVIPPLIGQTSRYAAQALTKRNAALADAVVRAGSDGTAIVSAYMRNTPKAMRKVDDLAKLLTEPDVNLPRGPLAPMVSNAVRRAETARRQRFGAATGGALSAQSAPTEEAQGPQ